MSILDTTIGAWTVLNEKTSAAGNATDLTVSQRTYTTVLSAISADAGNQAQISVYKLADSIESPANAMRFRCLSVTDGEVCTYNIYSGTLKSNPDCELSLLGTLSFTTGLQASLDVGYEMADQLTVTEGSTSAAFVDTTNNADDRIAETRIDLQGADLLVIVPTALGADAKLLGKPY